MMKKEKLLSTGATVSVNDNRVRVDLPPLTNSSSYQSISSAILNGGCHTFAASSSSQSTTHVINYKVPSTYDGLNPPPLGLLTNFAKKEQIDPANTVGLLTAASMESFAHSSRNAKGVSIDVIVTAGLSNSRSAGADADYFVVFEEDNNGEDDGQEMKLGTINTIIIVNAPLTPGAQVEAYAIAIEAKCSACVDHGVACAKDPTKLGMGTGTDCLALISQCIPTSSENGGVIKHAGKHTLFAELIGQAVYEATSSAIMINIRHLHGNYAMYTMIRWIRVLIATMKGARPCIPPKPMMPVPRAPISVLLLGISSVLSIIYLSPLPDKAKLILAAVAWDRYLGEPPLRFHPVCLAGSAISKCLSWTPDRVYKSSVLGFTCGLVLLFTFTCGAWIFIKCTDAMAVHGAIMLRSVCRDHCNKTLVDAVIDLTTWILKILLLKSTFSLQLLCTIALQMARFLERDQIDEARAQLSWLCSRDPSKLGASDLAGGTLESLSENLSDGFVAPLFWYVLLGPFGALGYRVVNTLDSRIGYRGKYEWLGKPSARFDDFINLFPARLTALLLALAATFVRGCSARRGLQTAWRDRGQCESPNAGWPMAMIAGILEVQLRKPGSYCLGDGADPGPVHIRAGHRLAQIAGGMSVIVAILATSTYMFH
ncbi:hypothetical protein ACHAXR_011367 [Thalassiosira sp. AJA248-18]